MLHTTVSAEHKLIFINKRIAFSLMPAYGCEFNRWMQHTY